MAASDLVDQVFFNRAQWRLKFLIPTWLVSLSISLTLLGIFAYRLAETIETWEDSGNRGNNPQVELAWECTNVAFSVVTLVLTIIEISKYAAETLTPFFLLGTQLVKITLALANLGLDAVATAQHEDGVYSPIGLALDCAQIAIVVALLIYAIYTYRRLLKFEDYHVAGGDKFDGHQEGLRGSARALGTTATITGRDRSSSLIHNPSVGYESQTAGVGSQVNQAVAVELGWTSSSTEVTRAGSVPIATVQSNAHLPRAQSWMSQRGLVMGGDDDDDGSETVRGGYDGPRFSHARIPSVVISEHGEQGHEQDDDTRALLGHGEDIGQRPLNAHYQDHSGSAPS